ncbi:MAG: PrgI family protein [Candidatus Doudnabacteria bacterium]
MQFAVPQFTEVEDKLIGPLTLKQFLFLLATGGVILFFYSLLQFSIFFFLFALPTALLGIGLTFGKFNGRPLFGYIGVFIHFVSRPQTRIFKREEASVVINIQKEAAPKGRAPLSEAEREPAESRLKKLAYLLDQKTAEEKELIQK